ncbi:MAG: hypothetical protein LBB54_03905 [Cellulomonadaceae bacterium]|jgi:hypothetical protein|nr:hypothetical protein [Cellulomonadaceae bacterium]
MSDQQSTSGENTDYKAKIDTATQSIKQAVTDGVEAAKPIWETKVAPAVSQGAGKAKDWTASTAKTVHSKAANFAAAPEEDNAKRIAHGAIEIGSGLLGLVGDGLKWVEEKAGAAAKPADAADATDTADAADVEDSPAE